jgi:hypothetical protein
VAESEKPSSHVYQDSPTTGKRAALVKQENSESLFRIHPEGHFRREHQRRTWATQAPRQRVGSRRPGKAHKHDANRKNLRSVSAWERASGGIGELRHGRTVFMCRSRGSLMPRA